MGGGQALRHLQAGAVQLSIRSWLQTRLAVCPDTTSASRQFATEQMELAAWRKSQVQAGVSQVSRCSCWPQMQLRMQAACIQVRG